MKFHCISGLPRAGSTLLAGLLRQNPRIHAGITSPLMSLICSLLNVMSAKSEWAHSFDSDKRVDILRATVMGYYLDRGEEVIFDTNRTWTGKINLLGKLFPGAKVICCVRDIPSILESMERLFQKNSDQPSRIFGFDPEIGLYERVDRMMAERGLVGMPYRLLKEAYFGEQQDKLLLIEYDSLVHKPLAILKSLYEFIGEEFYGEHDVGEVSYSEPEFDRVVGVPGLHDVKGPIRAMQHPLLLPPDLRERYGNGGMEFWRETQKEFDKDASQRSWSINVYGDNFRVASLFFLTSFPS